MLTVALLCGPSRAGLPMRPHPAVLVTLSRAQPSPTAERRKPTSLTVAALAVTRGMSLDELAAACAQEILMSADASQRMLAFVQLG